MPATPAWLLRIDDRLVHGQVCVGWCEQLGIGSLILADDGIADSTFERDLYACSPSPGQQLAFMSLIQLAVAMHKPPSETTLAVLLGPPELERLVAMGAPVNEVNVAGLHDQPGARRLTDFLFLTLDQEACLRRLLAHGIHLVGQPLPSSPKLDLARLL